MDLCGRDTPGALHEGQPCLGISEMLQKVMGEGSRKPPWKARLFVAKNGRRSALGLVQVGICCNRLIKSMFVLRAVNCVWCTASRTRQLCGMLTPRFNSSRAPVIFLWMDVVLWLVVFLRADNSGTASSSFSLSSTLPWWRCLCLPRSAACQCKEINRAWAGCCGFWFACLYIQKLSICSEQINMALMIGKEKKQTPVIKC